MRDLSKNQERRLLHPSPRLTSNMNIYPHIYAHTDTFTQTQITDIYTVGQRSKEEATLRKENVIPMKMFHLLQFRITSETEMLLSPSHSHTQSFSSFGETREIMKAQDILTIVQCKE